MRQGEEGQERRGKQGGPSSSSGSPIAGSTTRSDKAPPCPAWPQFPQMWKEMLGLDTWFPVQAEPQNPRFPGPHPDLQTQSWAWGLGIHVFQSSPGVCASLLISRGAGNRAAHGSLCWASEGLCSPRRHSTTSEPLLCRVLCQSGIQEVYRHFFFLKQFC